MGARFLAENFFNTVMFSAHTITGQDETTGNEGFRVGNARRHSRDYYTPQTANAQRYVEVVCDRPRYADMLVLDRNNNLAGKTVRVWGSNQSSFGTYTEAASVVIPTNVVLNAKLDKGVPVRTEEGAIPVYFNGHVYKYWRVVVDAGGANYKPQIGGAWLGKSWSPSKDPLRPWDEEARILAFDEVKSPALWSSATRKAQARTTNVSILVADAAEYAQARYHIHSMVWRGYTCWYVPDEDQAERTWLGYAPPGTYGAPLTNRPTGRDLEITLVEHQPVAN